MSAAGAASARVPGKRSSMSPEKSGASSAASLAVFMSRRVRIMRRSSGLVVKVFFCGLRFGGRAERERERERNTAV